MYNRNRLPLIVFYTIANHELQLSSDLEDSNGTDDWKSTNSHKGELWLSDLILTDKNAPQPHLQKGTFPFWLS